eukprot:scaffold130863_cov16-Tisochrysis_lutea.AAC.2
MPTSEDCSSYCWKVLASLLYALVTPVAHHRDEVWVQARHKDAQAIALGVLEQAVLVARRLAERLD